MPYCQCGNHVSNDFYRVYADNDGELKACQECSVSISLGKEIATEINDD